MAASKAIRKTQVADMATKLAAEMSKKIDAEVDEGADDRMTQKNADGGMLKCELTIAKRPGAPDPLCITVNEEFYWVKRGAKVIVPWYLVNHLALNIERKFRQEKDEQGKAVVVAEDMLAEPFSFSMINPAPGSSVGGVTA